MPDEDGPVVIAKSDLRLLYAKINAQDALLQTIIRTLVDSSTDPSGTLESLRLAAMEAGDIMKRRKNDPNPELVDQGMLDTLSFIAQTFSRVKGR